MLLAVRCMEEGKGKWKGNFLYVLILLTAPGALPQMGASGSEEA